MTRARIIGLGFGGIIILGTRYLERTGTTGIISDNGLYEVKFRISVIFGGGSDALIIFSVTGELSFDCITSSVPCTILLVHESVSITAGGVDIRAFS